MQGARVDAHCSNFYFSHQLVQRFHAQKFDYQKLRLVRPPQAQMEGQNRTIRLRLKDAGEFLPAVSMREQRQPVLIKYLEKISEILDHVNPFDTAV